MGIFDSISAALFQSSPSEPTQQQTMSKALVEQAIADNDIVIFSKSWCPYSKKAKTLIKSLSIEGKKLQIYELDEREDGDDIQAYLLNKSGQRTVPNIYIHQTHVGGSDDLAAAHRSGQLKKLLAN